MKPRILLVEDNDVLRRNLGTALERRGYSVLLASDGLAAMGYLLDDLVDVVVTDFKMRPFGGGLWLKFLEKHYSHLNVLIVTGAMPEQFQTLFPVLWKPYSIEDLEELI